jgi:RNA recognition motif-containing protein
MLRAPFGGPRLLWIAHQAKKMNNKLFVGNLSFQTTDVALQEAFGSCGQVTDCIIMRDKFTGRSRGFAFVTMGSEEEAQRAIETFNGQEFEGRKLEVNIARPREERPRSFGNERSFRGGGGGGRREGGGGREREFRRERRGGRF